MPRGNDIIIISWILCFYWTDIARVLSSPSVRGSIKLKWVATAQVLDSRLRGSGIAQVLSSPEYSGIQKVGMGSRTKF